MRLVVRNEMMVRRPSGGLHLGLTRVDMDSKSIDEGSIPSRPATINLDPTIKATWDEQYWLATTENPPIHGTGTTVQEAIADYRESLRELKQDLGDKSNGRLSEYWKAVKVAMDV